MHFEYAYDEVGRLVGAQRMEGADVTANLRYTYGLEALRMLNAGASTAVANFSRDIEPGSDMRHLTLRTVSAMTAAGQALTSEAALDLARQADLYQAAVRARNDVVSALRLFPKRDIEGVATVVGGYNKVTGEVTVGTKWFGAGRFCAEDVVVNKLGGKIEDVVMTPAIRPSNLKTIAVCPQCQLKFPRISFGAETTFAPVVTPREE